ncbi:MAG: hypothetical protein QHH10_11960 [Peptococcaceae bacterium]|jgi:hypothetical protein|nr:hypothetical protein [Peptococcaceae bacterium]MDH7526018.1 hypothetical protein [Peptococcaceae bacterium]
MDKLQKKLRAECRREGCKNAMYGRCRVYWGKRCNRLGGRKIPRLISKHDFMGIDGQIPVN